ncbi:hypothetical protein HZH66_006936 [Vespula vulgaris]|uniref:Cytochrome b5 n=1 Tax=Vespula vulgaris TaxID=7454 RepID=A0A834K287_VESVU|nr:cytochrome b5-like [Vespula vulgaris]KAF7399039.1 hypothetical protein HZH66_006936 [Vespula vulgaris]
MVQLKEYTKDEIQRTKAAGKVVIILHDKIYDVTEFLNEHPGGEEILIDHAGKDGTENFNDVGHSQDALDLMNKYKIGELVESERTNKPLKKGWVAGYNNKQPEKEKYVKGPGAPFYTLIAAIMLLAAIVFYNMS